MELVELKIESISVGKCIEEANKCLADAIAHCELYPSMTKPRIVVLEIEVKPDIHEDTGEYALEIAASSVVKLPKRRSASDRAAKKPDGYTVVGNAQYAPLQSKQMSLAEAPENVTQFAASGE